MSVWVCVCVSHLTIDTINEQSDAHKTCHYYVSICHSPRIVHGFDVHGIYIHGIYVHGPNVHGIYVHGTNVHGIYVHCTNVHGIYVSLSSHSYILRTTCV